MASSGSRREPIGRYSAALMDELTPEVLAELDVALEEATLVGVEMDVDARRFAATLAVLSLPPDDGPPPDDPRIKLVIEPVGRLAVSWRQAAWNDRKARSVPFEVERLSSIVAGFDQLSIYGWEFFDSKKKRLANRASGLSLDLDLGPERRHTLGFFRLAGDVLAPVSVDDVGAGGRRWWDALYEGDPRTASAGIFPLKN